MHSETRHSGTRAERDGRRLVRLFQFALTIGCLLAGPARAGAQGGEAAKALERIVTTGPARAFVKGNRVRLYGLGQDPAIMFKAHWKRGPLDGRGYTYHTAELELEEKPRRIPGSRSFWHEVTVLGQDAWRLCLLRAYQRLVPDQPGQGVYVQLMGGDRVLVRDSTGQVQFHLLQDKPSGTKILRRYNADEFAVEIARLVMSDLFSQYPGQTRFLGAYRSVSSAPCFILFDFSRHACVVLRGPSGAGQEGGVIPFSPELSIGASLILESHALALLKNPISCAGRLFNTAAQSLARLAEPRLPAFDAPVPALADTQEMDPDEWEDYLDRATGTKREPGTVRFLIDGENFFPLFRRRLEEARESIHLRVCIFDNDDVAVNTADLLKRVSNQVRVRVLIDRLSSQTSAQALPETLPDGFTPPKSIRAYLKHGSHVKVRAFLNPWLSCDHSKVFLIDRRFAYLGGMNIGREYRYEWHDMMVELQGPIVNELERDFRHGWAHASLLGDAAYAASLFGGPRTDFHCPEPTADCIGIRRLYTRTGALQIRKAVLEGIRHAKRSVFLENPYLYEDSVVAALVRARRRGVDVRVVLPRGTDIPGGNSSNYVTANYLLENGVRVFLYPGMTHVKALIVDGWACLGSANFNHLSLRLNQEVDVAISDAATVERLRRSLFEVDFEKSYELRREIPLGWTDHLVEALMNWF